MAFAEIELAKYRRTLDAWIEKNRPPPEVRPKLDFGYRIAGQSVELFEIRSTFGRPGEKRENPFAKATWNRSRGVWQVYWQRADLKWHSYQPVKAVGTLDKFLQTVREDKYACFFG